MWKGFFPEIYPGVNGNAGEVGIRNWSFWLALELCDYYERSEEREEEADAAERVHSYIMENSSEELSVEELLKDTKFTVTEVSAKIGYPNYAYFTKLFKKYSGYTPSAYRNRFGRKN